MTPNHDLIIVAIQLFLLPSSFFVISLFWLRSTVSKPFRPTQLHIVLLEPSGEDTSLGPEIALPYSQY